MRRGAEPERHPLNSFATLGVAETIVTSLSRQGFITPTPIQTQAIPSVLTGRDVLGIAATGTGKTAAFALPIIHRLTQNGPAKPGCRALILSPTRELAAQIADATRSFARGLPLRVALVIGGASMHKQAQELRRGVDIIVATPGRLLDHLKQRNVTLNQVETLVLDEADHMLDLGFIPSVRQLIRAMPAKRQNLFFSATMPREISGLADEILRDPVRVQVTPSATTVERVDQSAVFVDVARKAAYLATMLAGGSGGRTLVFTRTKRGADKVVRQLEAASLNAAAIHGNKSQGQRERALQSFRSAKVPILVATDIAARGIDIDGVELVVNFDLPHVPETYVHRIGRTARNGASGSAVSLVSGDDRALLKSIERTTRLAIPSQIAAGSQAERAQQAAMDVAAPAPRSPRPQRGRNGRPATSKPAARSATAAAGAGHEPRGRRKTEGDGSAIWTNYSSGDGRPKRPHRGRRKPFRPAARSAAHV